MVRVSQFVKSGEQIYHYAQNIYAFFVNWPDTSYKHSFNKITYSRIIEKQQKICRAIKGFKSKDQQSRKNLMMEGF